MRHVANENNFHLNAWPIYGFMTAVTEAATNPQTLRLADLSVGEEARVGEYLEMNEYCERLIRMGLIPGTTIQLERVAPLGDPVEIRFRGYALVLRPSEAECLPLERP